MVVKYMVVVIAVWASIGAAIADSQPLLPFRFDQPVMLCEFNPVKTEIPRFDEPQCRSAELVDIDPQNTSLWVSIEFDRPAQWPALSAPYGMFLFGKSASEVYLNEQLLGRNGFPGSAQNEAPGKMDAVFHVPSELLREQGNKLVMHLSGHHSLVTLGYPIHVIGFGQFGDTREHVQHLSRYGLVLLGAFVIGAIYFLFLSLGPRTKTVHRLFAALCCLAALQMGAELSRGLTHYTYHWHDLRLLAVTGLSFMFGTLLLAYSAYKVSQQHYLHWLYVGILLTIVTIIFLPGFDAKTTAGIFVPLVVSLGQILVYWRRHSDQRLRTWFWVQLLAAITIVISSAAFHEIIYFSLIACLLCYLFVQQAREHREQQQQLWDDESTIAKLEYKLAEKAQRSSPSKLILKSAGKTDVISTEEIAFCRASGDYVEIHLLNKSEKLFSGSLKQLEMDLPPTFLKVHRSYLVNLDEVVSLTGKAQTDTSENVLYLTNQTTVPVSRRLLPLVRDSLNQSTILSGS